MWIIQRHYIWMGRRDTQTLTMANMVKFIDSSLYEIFIKSGWYTKVKQNFIEALLTIGSYNLWNLVEHNHKLDMKFKNISIVQGSNFLYYSILHSNPIGSQTPIATNHKNLVGHTLPTISYESPTKEISIGT